MAFLTSLYSINHYSNFSQLPYSYESASIVVQPSTFYDCQVYIYPYIMSDVLLDVGEMQATTYPRL